MDYNEMMSFAPKDCQPTVLTEQTIYKEKAKRLGKKVEDLTEKEKQEAWDDHDKACMTDYDMLTS